MAPRSLARRPAVTFRIEGRVQGVGYRWWAMQTATRLGLAGWVRNRRDGSVEILAIGYPASIEALHEACRQGPEPAVVLAVERYTADDDGSVGFVEQATV
jgi:acylphosphatase